ncbi:MAG TPA: autotransporter-associated beta strand repeat-containing protein [Verrucomicrobiae bacterium]
MKLASRPFPMLALAAVLAIALALPANIRAAIITKADNTNSLNQGVSWVGGTAPGSTDVATWSGAYSGGPATSVVTNSLYAIFPNSSIYSWGGINIGALTGSSLTESPIFNNITSVSNITAASEAIVNGYNLVTITCNASHRFENGETVTITGVTPAGYNGTYIIAGVPAATQFTYTNATGALTAGTAFGTAAANMYVGGSGTPTSSILTNGTSGITIASGAPGVVLNAGSFVFSGNQTWNLASGTLLRFAANGSAASAVANNSGNDGLIEITGGGIASLNQAGAALNDIGTSFAGFSGSWQVDNGTTLRGIRGGADAWGSGTITLNGGILAVGGMSGDVGGWSWTTPIILAAGKTSYLSEQNVTGTGRYLQLFGAFSSSGNLVFTEPLVGATTFTSPDGGFIWCADGSGLSGGTITIGGPMENGVTNRLTYLRVGGANINGNNQVGSGANGSLGADNIVNNGVLTFTLNSLADGNVSGQISGTGTLRIGTLTSTAAYIGDGFQNITLNGVNSYTGPTIINAGTLTLAAGATIANSSTIAITTNSVNSGASVNTFDVSQLASGFTTAAGQTLSLNGGQVNGSLGFGPGSTNLIAPGGSNLVGTLTINGSLTLGGGANSFVLDINNSANDQISIVGDLTASGVTTLQFVPPGTGLNAGTYTLITVGGTLTATPANFSIAGLAAGARSQTFTMVVSGNTVQLVVVGSPGNLTWVGDGTANVWSPATTFSNWFNQVTSVKDIFVQNDSVTFDDSGSASPAINLTSTLTPGSVTVSASGNNYIFGGAGQIAGSTGLTMSGAGTLTINNSNSFVGNVLINGGGIVAITNEAALGEPTNANPQSLTLDNASVLLVTNTLAFGANTNRGIIIGTGGGTLIVSNGATLTVANVIGDLSGTSVLTKKGDGTLILNGNDNYGGGTLVNGGTVVCGNSHALGLSGSWSPGFTLQSGVVDIAGQGNYVNTNIGVNTNYLFNGVFITFAGGPGQTMQLVDSVPGHAGFGVNGTASINNVITYNGANNPGRAVISAPWYAVGTGTVPRTCVVAVDATTASPVGLEFQGQLSSLSYEGKVATIQKTGAGVMEISSTNYYPSLQVSAGTLLVNNLYALGTDRSPNYSLNGTTNGVGTGNPHQLIVDGGSVDLNGFSPAIGALSDNGGNTTGMITDNGGSASTLTLGYSASNTVNSASYAGIIADGTSAVAIIKTGTNTESLAGLNTYSGGTVINNGTLLINSPGQIGLGALASMVNVTGGSLGGSGTINAPVMVQSGGTLAPGAGAVSPTVLTITTDLTLMGTNLMNVDKDIATNDLVILTSGTVNYGGTLVVSTNLMTSTTLVSGDSFQLFNAPAHTGNFSSISGSPGAGLSYSFNPSSGVLSVVGFVPPPGITGITLSGTSLVINGTNGVAGEAYTVLTSTNVAMPLSQWTVLTTNTFTAGSFSLTNTVNSSAPQSFYTLRVP